MADGSVSHAHQAMQPPELQAHQAEFGFFMLAVIVLAIMGLIVLAALWGTFLDKHEHNHAKVRDVMLAGLALAACMEILFVFSDLANLWVLVISLVADIWGALDALLRYPAASGKAFVVKQLTLHFLKTVAWAMGYKSYARHGCKFILVLFYNLWGMPVTYIMSLPLDTRECVPKSDNHNVDISRRLWHLTWSAHERRQCLQTCKRWWYRRLSSASEYSGLARKAICAASPVYRRRFQKGSRCV